MEQVDEITHLMVLSWQDAAIPNTTNIITAVKYTIVSRIASLKEQGNVSKRYSRCFKVSKFQIRKTLPTQNTNAQIILSQLTPVALVRPKNLTSCPWIAKLPFSFWVDPDFLTYSYSKTWSHAGDHGRTCPFKIFGRLVGNHHSKPFCGSQYIPDVIGQVRWLRVKLLGLQYFSGDRKHISKGGFVEQDRRYK